MRRVDVAVPALDDAGDPVTPTGQLPPHDVLVMTDAGAIVGRAVSVECVQVGMAKMQLEVASAYTGQIRVETRPFGHRDASWG